jgi:hypothetical protein
MAVLNRRGRLPNRANSAHFLIRGKSSLEIAMSGIEMPNALDDDITHNHRAEQKTGDNYPRDWNTKIGKYG